MFAKADIVTVRKDSVISIPKDIIKNRRGGKLVYTVDRNSAEEKVIHTGISDDKYIEVEKRTRSRGQDRRERLRMVT